MSGRIRSIKPELLEDERTATLSHEAFRLFVSLLLLADDYGNLRAAPKLLEAQVFWARETLAGVSGLLRELSASGLVSTYEVRGQAYAHLCGWSKHQRVDKPGKPRCPGPELADSPSGIDIRESLANLSRDSSESLAPDLDLRSPIPIPTAEEDRSAAPVDVPDESEEQATICPLDLVERAERAGVIRDLAVWANVPDAVMRTEAEEFVSYWTIGKGMGRKKRLWMRELRERLRSRKHEGRLKPPGEAEHVGYVRQEKGLSEADRARIKAIAAKLPPAQGAA